MFYKLHQMTGSSSHQFKAFPEHAAFFYEAQKTDHYGKQLKKGPEEITLSRIFNFFRS